MLTILLLSFFGAIIAAVVGTFWYSNATPMGRIHMKSLGFDKLTEEEKKQKIEEAKPKMWKMYVGQIVLSFLTSFAVVFIVVLSMANGMSFAAAISYPLMSWLCFMVPIIGSGILWSNCDPKICWPKFFSDIFSNLLIIVLIAWMASFFV